MSAKKKIKKYKMKKYNKKDLKIFKGFLLEIKEKFSRQILSVEKDNLRTSQKDASGDLSSYSIHMADMATDSYDREFSLNMASVEQKVIYEIDEALKRIEEGGYGKCNICDGLIAKNRLKAVPYAKCCVACQNDHDREKKKNR